MKLNFGHKIAIVYLLFMGVILSLVYASFNQNIDLMAENYYEKEVNYQSTMKQTANALNLDVPVKIKVESENINIYFPANFNKKELLGNILFLRPNDKTKDQEFQFSKSNSLISYSIKKFTKGQYKVQLSWEYEGTKYYHEQTIVI